MAGKKITELTGTTNPSMSGVTAVAFGGTTYKTTLSTLRQSLVDSGSHYFTGSQHINGNVTITGSIKSLIVGTGSFHEDNPEILHVQNSGSYNIAHFESDNQYYAQLNIKNTNSGNNASTDLVLTADNGTEGVHYIDLGINSSTYTGGLVGLANDSYLLNVGKDMYIGTVGGINHPANLKLFAQNSWENAQIQISGSKQISFNTGSVSSGYTYEFSGSVKIDKKVNVRDITTDSELNLITNGDTVNVLGSNLNVQNGGISTNFNISSYGATIQRVTNIDSITEKIVSYNSPNTLITHNFVSGSIVYITGATSDLTIDVVDTPITNNRAIGLTVMIEQGSTAYEITDLQINSEDEGSVSINWYGGSQPGGTMNSTDIFAFSLIKVNNTWKVLGQKTSF